MRTGRVQRAAEGPLRANELQTLLRPRAGGDRHRTAFTRHDERAGCIARADALTDIIETQPNNRDIDQIVVFLFIFPPTPSTTRLGRLDDLDDRQSRDRRRRDHDLLDDIGCAR